MCAQCHVRAVPIVPQLPSSLLSFLSLKKKYHLQGTNKTIPNRVTMSCIINHKSFSSFNFGGMKINGTKSGMSGMKFGNLQDAHGDRVRIETPAMRIAWNTEPRTPKDQPDGNISAKLALSFKGMESEGGERMKLFFEFLTKMDQRVLELVKTQKGELWSKNMTDAKIESVYQFSIKEANDPKYAPTFTGKIRLEDNPHPESDAPRDLKTMKMNVFDSSKKPVSPFECKGGCMAMAILEASYVWCSPGMVGITWTVQSVLVKPKKHEDAFQFTELDEFEAASGDGTDEEDSGSVASSTSGEKRKRGVDDVERPDLGDDEVSFS